MVAEALERRRFARRRSGVHLPALVRFGEHRIECSCGEMLTATDNDSLVKAWAAHSGIPQPSVHRSPWRVGERIA